MHWLTIALVAPIAWAIVNHIDKYLLEKHFHNHGVGTLLLYSSLFGIVMLPIAALASPTSIDIPPMEAFLLIDIGIVTGIAIYLYLAALKDEEASLTIPIFQTIPIFGFIFGFFLLKETLSANQIYAGILIIMGAFILSLEFAEERRIRPKIKPLLLMLGSSALYGLSEVLFKFSALGNNFWTAIFWSNIGLTFFGIYIFAALRSDRVSFIHTFRIQSKQIIGINLASEGLTMVGNLSLLYAVLLAPVALVQLTTNLQPAMVLGIGIILTVFFPTIATEKISTKHLLHKLGSISIMFIGAWLLYT